MQSATPRRLCATQWAETSMPLILAAAIAFAAHCGVTPAAEGLLNGLSDADRQCLGCHAMEGFKKDLANGETLSLQVEGEAFAKSIHHALGCGGCHSDKDVKTHPQSGGGVIKSARQYSIERAETCRQCHDDAFKNYEGSVHAARLQQGNPLAPVCTGCHGVHAVTPKTAYETCVSCHSEALASHQRWLPNAARHHEVVSCAACHAPAALRMVDLRLYDSSTRSWVAEKPGEPWFEKMANSVDANGDGLDARELLELMTKINARDPKAEKTLRGRIELRNNVEAHRLAEKGSAIRACDNCHRAGAEPFHNVTVSVTAADGRPLRHIAKPEVLRSALAVAALPEFYAIGGTRSTLLDVLFVLALLGGAGFPLGHLAVRWLAKRKRS